MVHMQHSHFVVMHLPFIHATFFSTCSHMDIIHFQRYASVAHKTEEYMALTLKVQVATHGRSSYECSEFTPNLRQCEFSSLVLWEVRWADTGLESQAINVNHYSELQRYRKLLASEAYDSVQMWCHCNKQSNTTLAFA